MRIIKILGMMSIAAVFFIAVGTSAQTLSSVEVRSLSLTKTEYETGEKITGSFVLANTATSTVTAHYRVSLMGGYRDGVPHNTYGIILSDPITLRARQQRKIDFSLTIPQGLTGNNLGVHVEAETSNARPRTADKKITVSGYDRFVILAFQTVLVNGVSHPIDTVPIVDRSVDLIYNASFENNALGRFIITPHISIYKDSIKNNPVKTYTAAQFTIGYKEKRDVGIELPVLEKGTYVARIQFIDQNNQDRSAEGIVTYTRGSDLVTIKKINLSDKPVVKGDTISATVDYVLSPKMIGTENATLAVVVYNEEDTPIAAGSELISTDTATGTKIMALSVIRGGERFRAEAEVRRMDRVLSDYKPYVPASAEKIVKTFDAEASNLAASLLLVIILLIVGFTLIIVKQRKMGMWVLLILVGIGLVVTFTPTKAEAATGHNTGYCGGVVGGYITKKSSFYSALKAKAIKVTDKPTYTINGTRGTLTITITNDTDCQMKVSLGSYRLFNMVVQDQEFYDATDLITIPKGKAPGVPSVTTMTVQIPTCPSQTDFYIGIPAPTSIPLDTAVEEDPASLAWIRDTAGNTYWPSGTGHDPRYELTYASIEGGSKTLLQNSLLEKGPFCVKRPNTPTDFKAVPECGGTINLSWKAPSTSGGAGAATGYNLYRDGILIATITNASQLTYSDKSAGINSVHTYRIDAFNPGGRSDTVPSQQVYSGVCPPGIPTGVTAVPQACNSGKIVLSWNMTPGATSYSVYDGTTKIASNLTSTTFTHQSLVADSSHSYVVEAVNSGGGKKSSPAVNATAPSQCAVVAAPVITLSANPLTVNKNGTSTLTWTTKNNPTSCIASNGWSGNKAVTGGTQVTSALAADTTFTLSCSNTAGTDTKSVTVSVITPTDDTVQCQPENPSVPGVRITQASVGTPVKWVATGADGTYVWTGTVNATGENLRSITKVYTTVGQKNVQVSLNGGAQVQCDANSFKVSAQPGYREF